MSDLSICVKFGDTLDGCINKEIIIEKDFARSGLPGMVG